MKIRLNSLKFVIFIIFSFLNSFIYSQGIYSRYRNEKQGFELNVPITKYQREINNKIVVKNLEFIRKCNFIPSEDYFSMDTIFDDKSIIILRNEDSSSIISIQKSAYLEAGKKDSINEKSIKEYFLNIVGTEKEYKKFLNKYYNGKFPKKIDPLEYNYNMTLFILENNHNFIVKDKELKKSFYIISSISDNKVHYEKVISTDDGYFIFFSSSYPEKDKGFMENITNEIQNSIKNLN